MFLCFVVLTMRPDTNHGPQRRNPQGKCSPPRVLHSIDTPSEFIKAEISIVTYPASSRYSPSTSLSALERKRLIVIRMTFSFTFKAIPLIWCLKSLWTNQQSDCKI